MKGIYHLGNPGAVETHQSLADGHNGCFEQRKTRFKPAKKQFCNLTGNILSQVSSFKNFVARSICSGAEYVHRLSLPETGAVFAPVLVSTLPMAIKELWLNRLLTHEGFQALFKAALAVDKSVLNPAFRCMGTNIRYILSDLPIMKHAFYPKPAETARAIIGFLTDSTAGKILSCSLVSILLSSGFETYREIRAVQKAKRSNAGSDVSGVKDNLNFNINSYRSLVNRKLAEKNDLKGLIISAAIASVFAGPLVGIVSAGVASGARIGVRKLSQLYCQRQLRKLEEEMTRMIALEAEVRAEYHGKMPEKAGTGKPADIQTSVAEKEPLSELEPFNKEAFDVSQGNNDKSDKKGMKLDFEKEMDLIIQDLRSLQESIY